MLKVQNLSKQYSGQILFEDVSFAMQPGEKLGLVGRNGSGKSTLFKMILGEEQGDTGEIILPKNYRMGKLEQHISFSKDTVLDECIQVLPEDQKFEFYRAEKILTGLGFTDDDFRKSPSSFSGGFQIRINLCKSLLTNPNILLLDEPTNYLDILSLRWLKRFLNSFPGEVIIITHDRDFMDSVCDHIMGIHRQRLKKIKGNTTKFYEQREQEEDIYQKTKENHDRKRAHLESFVERFSAKASKASQAQSKLKQLEKMEQMEDLVSEANIGLKFHFSKCPSKNLMQIENLSFGYQPDQNLFKNLSFSIGAKDRIGIIGKNGKGKSTLLNVVAGELTPHTGSITSHPQVKIGHLGQTNVKRLSENATILEEVESANPELGQTKVRQICGSMLFTGDLALKKISVLSGGEKNRVLMARILANPTNLLFLDEPTNHLDMESIEILATELENYEGALVIVTHSEALLRRLVNRLIIFHKDGAEHFFGSYDDFLTKVGWEEEEEVQKTSKPKMNKKELHAKRQVIIKERAKFCKPLDKKIEELEKKITDLESQMEIINNELASASEQQDNALILELSQQVGSIQIKISTAFEELEVIDSQRQAYMDKFDQELKELES